MRRSEGRTRFGGAVPRHLRAEATAIAVSLATLLATCACGSAPLQQGAPGTSQAAIASTVSMPVTPETTYATPDDSLTSNSTAPAVAEPATGDDQNSRVSSTSISTTAAMNLDSSVRAAFAETAAALAPVPVYAPLDLPAGATLAREWPPLLASVLPHDAQIPFCNPDLLLEGTEPQGRVFVDTPGGALLFLENFRGDLGDISGEPAGEVSGRLAVRCELEGAKVLQWSDEGRWYAVLAAGAAVPWAAAAAPKLRVLQP